MDADLKTVLNFNLGYNGFLWNITPSHLPLSTDILEACLEVLLLVLELVGLVF